MNLLKSFFLLKNLCKKFLSTDLPATIRSRFKFFSLIFLKANKRSYIPLRFKKFPIKPKVKFLLILLLFSVFYEGKDWADSKSIQQEVLDAFPVDKVSNLHDGLILCLVPNYAGDVLIFEDTWSLNPAITTKYKNIDFVSSGCPESRVSRIQ